MGRLAGRIWVGSTTLLISFIGFTSQIGIIYPAHHHQISYDLLRVLVPFNLLLFLVFYNYYACVRTDPGGVPRGWAPDKRDTEDGAVEVKRMTGGPRFCRTCKEFKPPRAHHCRQCKKCVLKMDHHCPWVNNCVGFNNHGHFIRFLFWVDVACSYHLWMISTHAFHSLAFSGDPTVLQVLTLILNYTACVPVLVAVGSFSLFHFWSIATNTTTIEGHEKDKVAVLKRKGKIREFKYPYNLGYINNVRSVLGRTTLLWCWPQEMKGTGLKYPVNLDLNPEVQYLWPPRDEFAPPPAPRRRKLQPFTYSQDGLNPALVPTSSNLLRQRGALNKSPYHPDFEADAEDDEDDNIPLGRIVARERASFSSRSLLTEEEEDEAPERNVRVRRGSEGFEIRPRVEDHRHWEDGGSEEYYVDEEGDRVRAGERYQYYSRREKDGDSQEEEVSEFESTEDEYSSEEG